MLDERTMTIADDALAGKAPNRSDVMYLLRLDPYSAEAAYVCAKARELGMRACGGKGHVFAQIGVDATACPENCRFCTFAEMNVDPERYDPSNVEVPIGRIVHYARLFGDEGVRLISLMSTAGLDFDRYLDMVRAVAASVPEEVTIMANTADLTVDQATALREAGATAAYHALRLGEGEITSIKPINRRRTIRYLHVAGFRLMTGVEPIWRGVDALSLSERICDIPELEPYCIDACNLTELGEIASRALRPAFTGFVKYVAAITRLVCGDAVPIGGIGGVEWVDAGCDPRNRSYGTDDASLRKQIADARRRLQLDGFLVE